MTLDHPRSCRIGTTALIAAAGACASFGAQATVFDLHYTGWFGTAEALNLQSDATATYFDAPTSFSLLARFDDASPNMAPPSPPAPPPFAGFRAYAPISMSIDVAGMHFTLNDADNPLLSVSIFDRNSFTPGRYAVGFIVDPATDGAGIIGDFKSASPDYVVSDLKPTTFGDFAGAGHSSGTCISGFPPDCDHHVTPVVLRDAGNTAWNLTLAFYSQDYPEQGLNTAVLAAVPEPSTYALMLAGIGAFGWLARRQRR